jgi:hypothetical protein
VIEEFDINTIRRGLAAAGVVALITTGAAACGDDEPGTARGKVDNAFTKLGQQKALTVGLSFEATDQQIYDALKDGDSFTLDDAKILGGLHIKAGYSSDKALRDLTVGGKTDGASAALEVTSGDGGSAKPLIGLRSVDKTLYAQLDLKGITALDPENTELSDVNDLLDSVDQLGSSFDSVKALAHGQWVSLDVNAFTDFFKSLGGGSGSDSGDSDLGLPSDLPTGVPSDLAGKTFSQLVMPLHDVLTKDATLKDLGSKDGADHIKATIPAPLLAKEVQSWLKGSLGSLSKQLPSDFDESLARMPITPVTLDLALKGGELRGITVDLAQLDDTTHGSLPLALSIEGGAAQIDAPKGAKQLNPQDLMGLAMQQFGVKNESLDG